MANLLWVHRTSTKYVQTSKKKTLSHRCHCYSFKRRNISRVVSVFYFSFISDVRAALCILLCDCTVALLP